jgi:hypothetical protein
MMQMNEVKQRIDRVEQCADDAERAVQAGAPADLKECVESLHQQARQAQQSVSGGAQQMDQGAARDKVNQLEQTADRAMQACRNAGSNVTPQQQQAVQRAHQEISNLNKEIQMG